MSRKAAATSVLGFTVVGGILSGVATGRAPDAAFGVVLVTYASVGWLVVRRHPRNAVGWVLLAFGAVGALIGYAWAWERLASVAGGPGVALASWMQNWLWAPVIGLAVGPLLVLFPDGSLPSGRWRVVLWTSAAFVVLAGAGNAFFPFGEDEGGPNPYGIAGAEGGLDLARNLGGVALMLSVAGGVAALFIRYRRAGSVQRRQLKWFLAAAAAFPVAVVAGELGDQRLQPVTVPLALMLLAVAIGIAILRHGLYDIDRIISRTVSWALVTLVLAALYLAAVTVLTQLTSPVTGDSPIAVATSTLLAAAAFRPVRHRIQAGVDRRFNRVRYDAARTVETYRARLRDDLDLETVGETLRTAAGETVQPSCTLLWLRPQEGR